METSTNSIIEQKLIVLNSKNATKNNGEYLSNVRFNFKDILKRDDDIFYTEIALLTAEIPCSFYNINVNNNILKYTINSTSYTCTINEGNYSVSSFIAEFVSKFSLGGHSHTISVAFNKITGKLTTTKISGSYSIIFNSTGSTIYEVLGFLEGSNYTISTTLSHPYMLNLLGVKKLKILSKDFSLENFDSNGNTNSSLLHTISVDRPSYSLLVYQNSNTKLHRLKNKTVNEIEIQIRDENDKLIDFNNVYWDMSLILNIYRKFQPPIDETINLDSLAINQDLNTIQEIPLPTKTELKEIYNKIDEDNLRELEFLTL